MSEPTGFSGRPVAEVTLDAVRGGDVSNDDVRIHPDTLLHQAEVARAHANPNLDENLLRAAELTALSDEEVMALYELLRPHRASAAGRGAGATDLERRGAPRNAALFREAAAVYARRGLVQPG